MNTAAEQFIIELSRVSKLGSRYWRGLSRADRDDVIATAVLWCWENRADFESSGKTLERWFSDRLSAARMAHWRDRVPSEELNERMAPDNIEQSAQAEEAMQEMAENMSDSDRQIAEMLGAGYSDREIIRETNITRRSISLMRSRLKRFRDLIPDYAFRTAPAPTEASSDPNDREFAPIDHAVANLLRRPTTERADCPVCWRCCYFNGFQRPDNYHPPHHADAEVRQAVADIEDRKSTIAQGDV